MQRGLPGMNTGQPVSSSITVELQPDGEVLQLPRAKTVLQLLNRLKLKPTSALVIRNQQLLTPDMRIEPGDAITIRRVGSRG